MNYSRATALVDTERFFHSLYYKPGADERIEIRWKPLGSTSMKQEFYASVQIAVGRAFNLADKGDIYFGIGTRNGEDGTRSGVGRLGTLWADIDFKDDLTEDEAKSRILSLDLRPSIVVASGDGLHLYWLLREPVSTAGEIARAENVMKLLGAGLGGDSVYDSPRVLRVPGTYNYKGGAAKLVTFKRFKPDDRYDLADLETMAESLTGGAASEKRLSGWATPTDVLARPIEEGGRNRALTSVAGSLRHRGLDADTIGVVLCEVNDLRCSPPLPDSEVFKIARSGGRYENSSPHYLSKSRARRIYPGGENE